MSVRTGRLGHEPDHKDFSILASQQIGKYLIAPLARLEDGGLYTASVSIRSGRASLSHDRVMRFVPLFDSHEQASHYAVAQALAWIDAQTPCSDTFTMTTE